MNNNGTAMCVCVYKCYVSPHLVINQMDSDLVSMDIRARRSVQESQLSVVTDMECSD